MSILMLKDFMRYSAITENHRVRWPLKRKWWNCQKGNHFLFLDVQNCAYWKVEVILNRNQWNIT